ncbi:hypothetical protein AB0D42_29825 [Streptomyces sp. NPDC048304]|uniref:hypothetical protein n=1 Tax=Streptomyces sp. NPDC048304 TaxID=3154820 RepID=UPI0033DB2640
MDLDALRHGNFSQLGEAISDWEKMTQDLATLAEDARRKLKGAADKADWAGVNAQVSREFIDKTAQEFADAHTQADSITKILKDTRGELIAFRDELNDTLERSPYKYCTVIDTGDGTFTVTGNPRPDWSSDPSGNTSAISQKDVDDLRNEIQPILNKATEATTPRRRRSSSSSTRSSTASPAPTTRTGTKPPRRSRTPTGWPRSSRRTRMT